MVRLGNMRFLLLVVAVVLAALALRLWWGLHGPEAFRLGFEARAQEETSVACPDARLVDEFVGNGNQRTDSFDTTADSFRVTYDLMSTGDQEPSLNLLTYNEDGSPAADAFQSGEGIGETLVDQPQGTYFLDLSTTGDADYVVTVEQCEGADSSGEDRGSVEQFRQLAQQSPSDRPPDGPPPSGQPPKPTPPKPPEPQGGRLLEAGGPADGPVPTMPDGGCPAEFPTKQGSACYRQF